MRLARSTPLVGAGLTVALLVVVNGARAERRRALGGAERRRVPTEAAERPAPSGVGAGGEDRAPGLEAGDRRDRPAEHAASDRPGPEVRPLRRARSKPQVRPRRRERSGLDARLRSRVAAAVGALLRLLATTIAWLGLGLLVGLLLALTLPLALGMRPLVVVSGSMDPTLRVGDVTVVARIAPREARVGEVVTFRAPETGRITTHRLRAVRRTPGGRYAFTTKGDANNAVERWTLPADGELSRAVYRIPAIGRALLAIRTPIGWTLLVGLPLLVLGVQEIARIWRPRSEKPDAIVAT